MNKKFTALAIAAAGLAAQESHASVTLSAAAIGSVIEIGCTAPGTGGATVYSIDAGAYSGSTIDTITMPAGVSVGASCGYAINLLTSQTTVSGSTAGAIVPAGQNLTLKIGPSPVNLTIPSSGYSLQQYTFITQ